MFKAVGADERRGIVLAVAAVAAAGTLHYLAAGPVLVFVVATLALAGIANVIGESTGQLGNHLSPSAAGIIQSGVGNLPELFVCIFALRAGAVEVVQGALIGSILASVLLVLGLALVAGSARHGELKFESQSARTIALLLMLAVSALVLPTLAYELHLPAAQHGVELAVVCAIVLLAVFAVSTHASLKGSQRRIPPRARQREAAWPLALAVVVLGVCGVATVLVSDWFVAALDPAIVQLGISPAFAGLIIVAIASNTMGVAEIQLALEGKADLAVSVALNGALQVAVVLIPLLILISVVFFRDTPFILTIPPIMAVAVALSVLVAAIVTGDGQADIVDGAALIGLYVLIGAIFWWG